MMTSLRPRQGGLLTFLLPLVLSAPALADAAAAPSSPESAGAQDVTATYLRNVTTSQDPVTFAVPFDLVVVLDRAEGERIELPTTLPENKQVRPAGRPRRERTSSGPGRVNERLLIPMLALDTEDTKTPELVLRAPGGGRIEIPSVTITVVDPDAPNEQSGGAQPPGTKQPPGGATVGGAVVDGAAGVQQAQAPTAAVEPAKRHFLYSIADLRPWAVISTLVASLLALFASLWVERRRVFAEATPETEVAVVVDTMPPAHERALARLDALLNGPLLKEGQVESFVERLMNDVLRDYLEERFDLAAESQTTAELGEDLLKVGHVGLDVTTVRSLLENADLVKFARAGMQREVAHQMAQNVRALILSTAEKEAADG